MWQFGIHGMEYDVPFWFKQTGANFKKGNRICHIEGKDQMSQAGKKQQTSYETHDT